MSKKNQDYYLQLLQQMISQAQKPSPIQQSQQTDYANLQNFLAPASGAPDYRDPTGHGVVTGMLPLSEYQKQLKILAPQAGANTQLASRQSDLVGNQLQQDYGSEYTNRLNGLLGGENALGATLANDVQNTNNLTLQGQSTYLNALRNKQPGFWGQFGAGLLKGAAGAGLNRFSDWLHGGSASPGTSGGSSYPSTYGDPNNPGGNV